MDYSLQEACRWRQRPPQERQEYQGGLIRRHLRQAAKAPFYKKLFSEISLEIDAIRGPEDLRQLPLSSRADIEADPTAFLAVSPKQVADRAFTSGSTGGSLEVPYTQSDLERLAFNEMVNFHSIGTDPDDTFLLCVTLDRCFIAGLAYYSGLIRLGAAVIRGGAGQPGRQWELIERCQPQGLVGVPSFLMEMASWARERGLSPKDSSIEKIVTIGEPVRRADQQATVLGQKLAHAWGAKVFSSYGATELETAFAECREAQGGHVHPEMMIAEIVDPEGRIVPAGTPGELVVTPLGVEGLPLVRFRTGDIARLHEESCPCGWTTPRLGAVEGRLAQRLKYRGTTLYPEMIFQALDEIRPDSCSYLEVRSRFDLSDDIVVVVGGDPGEMHKGQIEEHLQNRLRVRPTVRLESKDKASRVLRSGGRKIRRFFDLRGEDL